MRSDAAVAPRVVHHHLRQPEVARGIAGGEDVADVLPSPSGRVRHASRRPAQVEGVDPPR